ncbi:MAG: NAD(P)/FAD-dependent oxidoreductase [Betaproteobacteria bacterium]
MPAYDAIVVGAGITGASTAYHLKKRGMKRVLLVDREGPAAGGTGKSAAIIRQHYSSALLVGLARASIGMLAAMPEALGRSGGYVRAGYFFLVDDAMLAGAQANVAMQRAAGVDTRFLEGGEIEALCPWLDTRGVAGVIHEPDGGYADPVQSTEAFVHGLRALGGEFRAKAPARALVRSAERVTGVAFDDEEISAAAVVNAAGPWAAPLAASAGIPLQIRTVREQDTIWEARAGRALPQGSVSNGVDAIYLRPLGERRFVVGRGFPKQYYDVDPYNYKLTADDWFVGDVQSRMEKRFPPLAGAKLVAAYAALYDVSLDWYPYVGPRKGLEGYYDASGGSGHGFKIGPAIGKELADWIVDGRTGAQFARLSYDRTTEDRLFTQAFGGNRG